MKKFQNLLLCYLILKKCIHMCVFTGNDALRCGGGKLFIGEVIGLFSTFPTCLCLLSTMHMCCFLFIVLFFKLFFDVDCF